MFTTRIHYRCKFFEELSFGLAGLIPGQRTTVAVGKSSTIFQEWTLQRMQTQPINEMIFFNFETCLTMQTIFVRSQLARFGLKIELGRFAGQAWLKKQLRVTRGSKEATKKLHRNLKWILDSEKRFHFLLNQNSYGNWFTYINTNDLWIPSSELEPFNFECTRTPLQNQGNQVCTTGVVAKLWCTKQCITYDAYTPTPLTPDRWLRLFQYTREPICMCKYRRAEATTTSTGIMRRQFWESVTHTASDQPTSPTGLPETGRWNSIKH